MEDKYAIVKDKVSPDLLVPPHIANELFDIVMGEWELDSTQQEQMVEHLRECELRFLSISSTTILSFTLGQFWKALFSAMCYILLSNHEITCSKVPVSGTEAFTSILNGMTTNLR